jgi:hypothetical protein
MSSRNIVPLSAAWKSPARGPSAPEKDPFLWPNSSLRQRLGHRAAIHRDEGEAAALLVEAVNGPREYLLTRAGLTLQQHGGVADLSCFVGVTLCCLLHGKG